TRARAAAAARGRSRRDPRTADRRGSAPAGSCRHLGGLELDAYGTVSEHGEIRRMENRWPGLVADAVHALAQLHVGNALELRQIEKRQRDVLVRRIGGER